MYQRICGGGRGYSPSGYHQLLTMKVWVQSQASPCRICVAQSGSGTGLSPNTAVSSCPYDSINSVMHNGSYIGPAIDNIKNMTLKTQRGHKDINGQKTGEMGIF